MNKVDENITGDVKDHGKSLLIFSMALLIVLLIVRFAALLYPDARIWSLNQLVFLPDSFIVIFSILAAAALVSIFIRPVMRFSDSFVSAANNAFFESGRKYYHRLIFTVISGVIFIIFAAPTHFLGDGYALIANLGSDAGMFHKWSERWITLLLSNIQALIGPKNPQTAKTAFQIVSVFSGVVTVWFYFLIANIISDDKYKKIFALTVMYLSPVLLLFFGYVENYPLLWAPLTGFVYFGLKRARTGRGLVPAGIFLALGIGIHLQMAVLFPAFLFLILCRGRGHDFYQKAKIILWIVAGIAVIAILFLFIRKYNADLYFRNIFLPLFEGKDNYPEYFLLGWKHLTDMGNQLLLLSPLLPVLILFSYRKLSHIIKSSEAFFLMTVALFSLIFLLIIDPKLSMPRDWDLFSFAAFGLNLMFIYMMGHSAAAVVRRIFPSILLYLVVAVLPFLLVNLNTGRSIAFCDYIIELDRPKSMSSIVVLRDYYRNIGDREGVQRARLMIDRYFPNEKRMDQAFAALDKGNIELAETLMQSIRPDNNSPIYHNLVSLLNLYQGNNEKALEESKIALQLRQYDPLLMCNHAIILAAMERHEEALETLKRAYTLNNSSRVVVEGLATVYMELGIPDSVRHYGLRLMEIDSTATVGYFMIAKSYARSGDTANARPFYDKYINLGWNDMYYDSKCAELRQLLKIE